MEFKGKITSAFQGQKGTMLSIVSLFSLKDLEGLDFNKEYRVTIKEWKDKRSLDANGYLWSLLSKMAQKLDTSKEELEEDYLQKYGLLDEEVIVTVATKVDMSKIEGHWRYLKGSSDGKWKSYIRIRGTHEYDSTEFSHFLQQVIEGAKELGIETMTPAELARLKYE